MKTNPVGWFEIYVQDTNRARSFYETVLQSRLEQLPSPEIEMWAFPTQNGGPGASGALVFGVRPENVHLEDAAAFKGRVMATEYLGTTQIVTLETACGVIKARTAADRVALVGDTTGLRFDERSVTLFDAGGRALLSIANQRVLQHG